MELRLVFVEDLTFKSDVLLQLFDSIAVLYYTPTVS